MFKFQAPSDKVHFSQEICSLLSVVLLQDKQPVTAAAHAGGFCHSIPLCLKHVNKASSGTVQILILCKDISPLTLAPLIGLCFMT